MLLRVRQKVCDWRVSQDVTNITSVSESGHTAAGAVELAC